MCGIIGIVYDHYLAAKDVYAGLMHLQHRGKEAARIVTTNGQNFYQGGGKGEIARAFSGIESLTKLKGSIGIGQTRYSTTGGSIDWDNLQPIRGYFQERYPFYVVHNGNIVNLNIDNINCRRSGMSDTYQFVQKLAHSKCFDFKEAVIETVKLLKGSFCFIILFEGELIVVKDRFGFCPLVIGKKNGGHVVASETCALDMIGAEFIRDVFPGEITVIAPDSIKTEYWANSTNLKFSIFEFIYFLRPDSKVFGVEAGLARQCIGRRLALRSPVPAGMIVPIPDSANDLALGYYLENLKWHPKAVFQPNAFLRSHYVGRTFIEPLRKNRELAQKQKFNIRSSLFRDVKDVILLDDSLIRSTVMSWRVKDIASLPGNEKRRIHARIGSPPYAHGDYYGVDTYRNGESLAIKLFNHNIDKLASHIGLASLVYSDLYEEVIGGILDAQEMTTENGVFDCNSFYTGPFTGDYPDGTGVYFS